MPLQSGSDRDPEGHAPGLPPGPLPGHPGPGPGRIPDAAITTDIIVGFPGETEQDFAGTLDLVRQARFAGAFTFRYSIRPGTPAATMADQVPPAVVQERYERLTALVEEITWAENQKLAGATVEVLVAEGEGRKDAATHRMSGRARDNRLVHFAPHEARPRAPATSSPPPSPAAPRTTCWPTTPRWPSAAPRPGTPGKPPRPPPPSPPTPPRRPAMLRS